jgi:phosphatidylinositol alpha-mannosyltransferase
MRIGLVCPYNIFKNGGVQECVLALQAEYEARGHQAVIVTPRPKGIETDHVDGIQLIGTSRDIKSPFHTTAQVSVSFDNTAIDDFLHTSKFDVLHFHEPWVPIVSRQILTRSNSVNIATFHAKLPETVMSKTIERVITPYTRSILKYIDAFTAVSDAAAEYISSISQEEVTLIPNGIDIDKFAPKDTNRDPHTIVYIGRLEKRKGVRYLLDAFRQVQSEQPKSRLIIAGDGPEREKLEDLVDEYNLNQVEFLGYVDDATKIKLLQSTTVFCSPAIYGESFGIVLLEAMSAHAVTVAANNPGYTSVLKDKGTLSLVNVKDTGEFARRLLFMMNDRDVRKLWLDWATTYVTQFKYKHVADMYLDVYKKSLEAHKT